MKTWLLVFTLSLSVAALQGAPVLLPNPSFEAGVATPAGWTSASESSAWAKSGGADGSRYVTVTGAGQDSTYWRSETVAFAPGKLYRVTFRSRGEGASGGTAVTGPVFCNWDIGCPGASWREYTTVFACPDDLEPATSWLRFGQWEVNGTIGFDDIRMTSVQPLYKRIGELELGEGERLDGTRYTFNAPLGGDGRNHSRPLAINRCGFNSMRWVFGADSEVVYRHVIGDRRQREAALEVTVGWYAGGQLTVDASRDGVTWVPLGVRAELGTLHADVPATLLPAREIRVRLRAKAKQKVGSADSDPGSFQVYGYQYQATLDGEAIQAEGSTRYVEVDGPTAGFEVALVSLGDGLPGADNRAVLDVRHTGPEALTVTPVVTMSNVAGTVETFAGDVVTLVPGATRIDCPYGVPGTGEWTVLLTLGAPVSWSARATLLVPTFYATSYGGLLPGSSATVGLWSASSGWKVPRTRSLPSVQVPALALSAAAREAEAIQLVVRPEQALTGLTLSPGDLVGPGGARLAASTVEIMEVAYVPVAHRTDATGVVADWPDPLPPLAGPMDLAAGVNQPFWVRVRVPAGTAAGLYSGAIDLRAEGYSAQVGLQVEVYGFELPLRMTCETAFGFDPGAVWRYQGIIDPAERRAVLDLYWRNFAEHHISPYNPAPLDPFSITWPGLGSWQGGTRDHETKDVGESSLVLRDTDETANVSARYTNQLRIPPSGFRFRFRYRTGGPGRAFIVTFNHHDAGGQWMSGRNNDMAVEGDGSWQTFERTITTFPAGAESIGLTLWATPYAEDGHFTGTVWFDDLSVVDLDSGRNLVVGGDFEPADMGDLTPAFDWEAWDRATARGFDELGFNSLSFPILGLGSGTFHSRTEPSILGYGEDQPEYAVIMAAYLAGVESHLREKGWLDEAYVYWFDEPDPKDYAFVMNGFAKLKRWAPGMRRMLTEQVEEDLVGGPNLWCPISPDFDSAKAAVRRQAGEQFWWYVCTGPKAPYCTLFIDHPGTELRVWLWQTWERAIEGILVWQSNYWSSSAAYPDAASPQNPYTDPMGWVSGYSTPAGTKQAWGNGDGRFIYPPVAAADGNPDAAVLAGPVDSIRWEMLRDGLEDYEYFAILKRLLNEKRERLSAAQRDRLAQLLVVPVGVTKEMTEFTTDPAPLEAHRHQLGQAIGALTAE